MRYPRVRSTFSRLMYRFRPDLPEIGSELVTVKDEPRVTSFSHGQTLRVISWNTLKGKRAEYIETLAYSASSASLLLLQEFKESAAFDTAHQEILSGMDARMAVSFFTLQSRLSPTGVMTASPCQTIKSVVVASRFHEPVLKTPKMALCSWFPIDQSLELSSALLVVNCHGINFRLRSSFSTQMAQLKENVYSHTGPIVFVGDFNTWEKGREKILDTLADELRLTRILFPKGIKHVGGHQLDRVYVRGGTVTHVGVTVNHHASDHALLSFDFTIA